MDAVALGGSRAQAKNRPDSNWDLAVYYRDGFDPQTVRDLGWPGQLIDIHYRDLGLIDEIHDAALRESAPRTWWQRAEMTLFYASEGHAKHGRIAQYAGLLSEAACHTAHLILAHWGEWITNEEQLLSKAGLRKIDNIVSRMGTDSNSLIQAVSDAHILLLGAVQDEGINTG